MSILYATLINNKDKNKIAESIIGKDFQMRVKNILPQIFKNTINDRIEFEQFYLTYTRSKEIIYLCVSPKKIGEERPRKFIEILINKLDIVKSANNLDKEIDNQIKNFNSGFEDRGDIVKDIQKDLDEVKVEIKSALKKQTENVTMLEENLIKTAVNIKENARDFRRDARRMEGETRFCCKPWVIKTTIISGSVMTVFIIYMVVALIRCENVINAFCDSVEPINSF